MMWPVTGRCPSCPFCQFFDPSESVFMNLPMPPVWRFKHARSGALGITLRGAAAGFFVRPGEGRGPGGWKNRIFSLPKIGSNFFPAPFDRVPRGRGVPPLQVGGGGWSAGPPGGGGSPTFKRSLVGSGTGRWLRDWRDVGHPEALKWRGLWIQRTAEV